MPCRATDKAGRNIRVDSMFVIEVSREIAGWYNEMRVRQR